MKVSIITPSFNQGEFIARTLASVQQQKQFLPSTVCLEHVIYDGGSTDNTLDILKSFESDIRHQKSIVWVSEPDNGQTHAVNKGLANSDGEIIGWLNSDDVYYPGAIAKVLDYFNNNPTVEVIFGMAQHIDTTDKVIDEYPTSDFDLQKLFTTCFICQPAVFFRRSVLSKVGLLNESLHYCMDYEFWVRMALHGVKFAYLQDFLAGSRLYPENKTLRAKVAVHAEINDMLKSHLCYVPTSVLINYAYAVVGQDVDKNAQPYKFAWRLFWVALQASKRWNGAQLRFLQEALAHWLLALRRGRFKMWCKLC